MKQLLILVMISPLLMGCPEKKALPKIDNGESACEFVKRVLFPNCSFRITPAMQEALGEENSTKLDAAKRFFRTCPQYKECLSSAKP